MVKLESEKQFVVNYENLKEILINYDIRDFKFEAFTKGISNSTIKITTPNTIYVLRIYRCSYKDDKKIKIEVGFQNYLGMHNIPVPKIYKDKTGQELNHTIINNRIWQVLLMEYKEGTTSNTYSESLLIELAQIQANMHLLGIEFA